MLTLARAMFGVNVFQTIRVVPLPLDSHLGESRLALTSIQSYNPVTKLPQIDLASFFVVSC